MSCSPIPTISSPAQVPSLLIFRFCVCYAHAHFHTCYILWASYLSLLTERHDWHSWEGPTVGIKHRLLCSLFYWQTVQFTSNFRSFINCAAVDMPHCAPVQVPHSGLILSSPNPYFCPCPETAMSFAKKALTGVQRGLQTITHGTLWRRDEELGCRWWGRKRLMCPGRSAEGFKE